MEKIAVSHYHKTVRIGIMKIYFLNGNTTIKEKKNLFHQNVLVLE